jgi:putative DNA primase/helicase
MEPRAAAPEDYFTKHIGIAFDPAAKCPRWEQFLIEIFASDVELISFVKRAVGYCLTGDTREQCIFFCYGTGANGKSTFLDILLKLFGGYGIECAPETFMVRKNVSNTRDDLLRLQSARLIVTSELEESERLAEALIKRWTGGEGTAARITLTGARAYVPIGCAFLARLLKNGLLTLSVRNYSRMRPWLCSCRKQLAC